MKIDLYPVGAEQHAAADEEHRKRTKDNKRTLREIADLLEAEQPLSRIQIEFAAAALRHVADIMSSERPRPNKRPPVVPGDAAVLVAMYVVLRGMTKQAAMRELAELWSIDEISTIEKALSRQGYTKIKVELEKRQKK